MGWSLGYDNNWKRDIGYGVAAYCDHPKCNEEIDRGISYVCGGYPHGGEYGCGLFFCPKHMYCHKFRYVGYKSVCKRCETHKPHYKHLKQDHPEWIRWKLKDKSWKEWRKNNPEKVSEYRNILSTNQ